MLPPTPNGETRGIVDQALAGIGLERTVVAAVPFFFPALATLGTSDLVATLPSRLALNYCPAFGLESRELPLPIKPFAVTAVRHRRDERSPMHRWLIDTIRCSMESTD